MCTVMYLCPGGVSVALVMKGISVKSDVVPLLLAKSISRFREFEWVHKLNYDNGNRAA